VVVRLAQAPASWYAMEECIKTDRGLGMSAQPHRYITVEEYLAGERSGELRHEYYRGEVFALAGGSSRHNIIAGNIYASLHSQFRKRECRVYSSDMRVKMRRVGLYVYPDVSALCGPPEFDDEHEDTLLNPSVIIEVLSPSTENYDRGKKFQHYRTLESLQEYLLVAQDSYHTEHYTRQDTFHWLLSEFDGLSGELALPPIGCQLRLEEIYEKIVFDQAGDSAV
jgi:Uma2 family endonuclease